jgi:hypothetical protein
VLEWGTPGLGVSQTFFVPVVLAGLATDATGGAAAGVVAVCLYFAAEILSGRKDWDAVITASTSIKLLAYILAGAIVGWFAVRARLMLADSLHVLDAVVGFARRDPSTGLRTATAFEESLAERRSRAAPFVLLLVELTSEPRGAWDRDAATRRNAALVASCLAPGAELAALGPQRVGALVEGRDAAAARGCADELERELFAAQTEATVGWAFHPADGRSALELLATAVERLQARRIVRGEWAPTPESAGLVETFPAA